MNVSLQKTAVALWSKPDPVLVGAGAAGELFIAKLRLGLAASLLLIPILNTILFRMEGTEAFVGIGLTVSAFLISAGAYAIAARVQAPWWLSFATSFFDVTLVTVGLGAFLFFNQPHTAVNSKVIFEGYFLAIAGTSLRYDRRVCFAAGLLALTEYFSLVAYTARHWELNSEAFAPYPYGLFSWSAQISRLILMLIASALTIAIVTRSQKLLRLATLDPLTTLYNRGYVDDRFNIELSRTQRYGQSLTIAVLDVDQFKAFNDTHGHAAGDVALRSLSAILRQSFRQSDTVGRYGGEEFVVLMPETDIEAAHQKLESVRATIASSPINLPSGVKLNSITISAGLAEFPAEGSNEADLFAIADERLFQAKRAGRNRVISAADISIDRTKVSA